MSTDTLKRIPNFPNYLADTDGNIYTLLTKSGRPRMLKQVKHHTGYFVVTLTKDKKQALKSVHRLILETFTGKCPPWMQACHNDGNKCNNAVSNLRWDTAINNQKDREKHGTKSEGEKNDRSKLNYLQVRIIKSLKGDIPIKELGNIFGISFSVVSKIQLNQLWRCANSHKFREHNKK